MLRALGISISVLALVACAAQPKSSQDLGLAVIAGDVAKVQALLSAGADPNASVPPKKHNDPLLSQC